MKEIDRKAWANLFVFNLTTGPDGRFPATADELQVIVEEVYAQAAASAYEDAAQVAEDTTLGAHHRLQITAANDREGLTIAILQIGLLMREATAAAIRARGTVRPTDSERKEGDDA